MLLRFLILFNVCMCTSWEYDVITLVFSKKERRHKSYKMCIVDKSFIQLQFHEANILIVQLFGQLTKGIFYNLKILTLSCFRRHKDLKLLLNLLAETSGVSQLFFLQLCLLVQKKNLNMFSSYLNAQHIFDNLTPGLPESFRILTLFDKKFQSLWKPQVRTICICQ